MQVAVGQVPSAVTGAATEIGDPQWVEIGGKQADQPIADPALKLGRGIVAGCRTVEGLSCTRDDRRFS